MTFVVVRGFPFCLPAALLSPFPKLFQHIFILFRREKRFLFLLYSLHPVSWFREECSSSTKNPFPLPFLIRVGVVCCGSGLVFLDIDFVGRVLLCRVYHEILYSEQILQQTKTPLMSYFCLLVTFAIPLQTIIFNSFPFLNCIYVYFS